MTAAASGPPRRRSLILAGALAALGCAVLVSLGSWQVERKAWKEALIATLSHRAAAAPDPLPPAARWQRLDAAGSEFRRVVFRAELLNDREALVFTSGSSLRHDASGPGYWVFTPARVGDGALVVVDRGFVPEGRQAASTRREGEIAGPVEIVGALRWPEPRGIFTPADNPRHNLWFVRDQLTIAAAKGWGAVAPFYVEQESPAPPGGLPHPSSLVPNLPNNHLQYAITWYGLAMVLAGVFVAFAISQGRESRNMRAGAPPT